MLGRFEFRRVFFILVPHLGNFRLPVKGVVVKIHFRVERDDIAASSHDERIDFDQRRVEFRESLIHSRQKFDSRRNLLSFEAETEGDLAGIKAFHPEDRVDRHLNDFLRGFLGDFLDIHAAFRGGHDRNSACDPVHQDTQINFSRDITAVFDVDTLYFFAGLARLLCDERPAQHGGCMR